MSVINAILPIPLTSFNTTGLSGTYQSINSSGTTKPCFAIRIINNSDQDVTVSYDGLNDHDFVPANSTAAFALQTNSQPNNMVAKLRQGTIIYVKGSGAGTGLVYLSGYYQAQR